MAKIKTALIEPEIDQRLVDERGPTAERMKGAEFEVGDSGVLTIRQSPVERAFARGTLTARQLDASERFYAHWRRAQLDGSPQSPDLDRVLGQGSPERMCRTEAEAASFHVIGRLTGIIRLKRDAAGERGDHTVQVLELIVCRENTFAQAGQIIGFRGAAAESRALGHLRGALNILIDEWGL